MTGPDPGSGPAGGLRPSPAAGGGDGERRGTGLTPGLRATVAARVTRADTAAALGSGDVEVLGTPRLLALAEAATVAAVAPVISGSRTTVGTAVALRHKRPSGIGARVAVEAELTEIDGRRLVFSFIARMVDGGGADGGDGADADGGHADLEDRSGIIGTGTIERVLVDRERFGHTPVVDRG